LEIIAEHKVIVEALADRSPGDAAAAMRTHLYSVDHAIARLQPLYAGYFVGE
jgi:DNA-binding FadR family transcriptional regulator